MEENPTSSNAHNRKISKEEVIAKLKDDGDFDRLRLKLIRKLKDNEELRNHIISVVKQSAALNCVGAENMKPRQLSDAIYDEIEDKVLSQISDGLWGIIRSEDGMKCEITETVQSVYNRLVNPGGDKEVGSSTSVTTPLVKGTNDSSSIKASVGEVGFIVSDNEPKEPPGFTLSNNHHGNDNDKQHEDELGLSTSWDKGHEGQKEDSRHSENVLEADEADHSLPPGFSADVEQKQPSDGSDDDPEVPPGFG